MSDFGHTPRYGTTTRWIQTLTRLYRILFNNGMGLELPSDNDNTVFLPVEYILQNDWKNGNKFYVKILIPQKSNTLNIFESSVQYSHLCIIPPSNHSLAITL